MTFRHEEFQASLAALLIEGGIMLELASLLLLLQNMLLDIEEKVLTLSELSLHSEALLLEGRPETRDEAEQLSRKLRTLKSNLVELQRMLQDKQMNIQVNI